MGKKIFKLENLIYLTVFMLPTYLLRFGAVGFSVSVLDCLLLASIAWWLIFYRKEQNRTLFFQKYKALVLATGLIFFGLVVSVLLNKQYVTGMGIVISWFLLPTLFSLVASLIVPENRQKNIFLAYYFSAFVVALISLVYPALGFITYDGRLQGFFNSPNYLAMYLAPAIFISHGLFQTATPQKRYLFGISGVVILCALYLTYSYASWLAVGLALGFVFAIGKELSWRKGLIGILFVAVLFFLQADRSKFSNLVNANNRSSLNSRMMIWQSAGKMLEQNWFWGIGAGNFQEKYLENQKYFPPYLEWAVPHPHNLYLAFWLYGGVFGLLGFLLLVYFWFRAIFHSQKNPQLKLIGLGIMFYILLHGLVDTTYFKNDLAVVFWLLFTLI